VSDSSINKSLYRGRFAPSPTGPLHFGSLVCAVASYLQAKSNNGEWLVRMEDIDPPREPEGAADDILRTLEAYGLFWDREVVYQSRRQEVYEDHLRQLKNQKLIYPCCCSRKQIRATSMHQSNPVYPETCRGRPLASRSTHSIRLQTKFQQVGFDDGIQGTFAQNIRKEVGDFVLKRADGYYAYQLAVVVDDAEQGISEIVRGSDLLDNTPRQIYLQKLLNFPQPHYVHVPIATQNGDKMSKQTNAPPVTKDSPLATAVQILQFLAQAVPDNWQWANIEELWQWAIPRWEISAVPRTLSREYVVQPDNS
jgi:glutamyl-Q tRNA(Asp) synthetase